MQILIRERGWILILAILQILWGVTFFLKYLLPEGFIMALIVIGAGVLLVGAWRALGNKNETQAGDFLRFYFVAQGFYVLMSVTYEIMGFAWVNL